MIWRDVPHDAECAIEMWTQCNYRCPYCTGPRTAKATQRGRTEEDADAVIRFFNDSGKRWLIGLSGGEPTIHPQFERIVSGLACGHSYHMFSNGSFSTPWFMNAMPADRVAALKLSLQPEGDMDQLLRKAGDLQWNGYPVQVTMVAAPDVLDRLHEAADTAARLAIPFTAQALEGPYRGKMYPIDYTDDERTVIALYLHEVGNRIRFDERTIGGMDTCGQWCPSGYSSFHLDMDTGQFTRCESVRGDHGNIYDGTFRASPEIRQCPAVDACVGYNRYPKLPWLYGALPPYDSKREWDDEDGGNVFRYHRVAMAEHDSGYTDKMGMYGKLYHFTQDQRFVFWGAGIYGAKILALLLPGDTKPIAFLDSNPDRQGDSIAGIPIVSPDDCPACDRIIITSQAFEDDIYADAVRRAWGDKTLRLHKDVWRQG